MTVLSCARDLAAARGISAPILLLTDNSMLREHLHSGIMQVGDEEGEGGI